MVRFFNMIFRDQDGQGMVEYGLIISLVILAVIGALNFFGIGVGDLFDNIDTKTSEVL